MSSARRVVVWGNCQAAPIADLLRAPLARVGLQVVDVAPVYQLTPHEVAEVHARMDETALLVSQPIADEYRVPGCSTERLAAGLPPTGRLVTYPLVYHSGGLPYQVTANGADGVRAAAPLTDYHDLRLLTAAAQGRSPHDVLASWPVRAPAAGVEANAAASLAELRRREARCDVAVADLVDDPAAMFTLNHPDNVVLAEVARRILRVVGGPAEREEVTAPAREYLGAVRTPLDTSGAPTSWLIGGRDVPWAVVIAEHLAWYRTRPDVVRDGLTRNARRLALLELEDR